MGGQRCRRKLLQKRDDVDLLSLTAWQMLFGSLPLLPSPLLTSPARPSGRRRSLALAYNVLLANALAWFLWLFGLRVLSAGNAGHRHAGDAGDRRGRGLDPAWRAALRGEAAGMALIIGALGVVTLAQAVAGRRWLLDTKDGRPIAARKSPL